MIGQRYPGLSSKQLALTVEAQATGCDRPMIARRLPDLEERGFVKRGEKVRGAELRWFPCPETRQESAGIVPPRARGSAPGSQGLPGRDRATSGILEGHPGGRRGEAS